MLDNSHLVAQYIAEEYDGDRFWYTEMLDRSKTKGNNGQRLMKTFYHRHRQEFWDQWEMIKRVCDMSQVRAMTRLAPRSYKAVAHTHSRLVLESLIAGNHEGVKTLYQKACGTTPPLRKVWIWDIDVINEKTRCFEDALTKFTDHSGEKVFLGTIPSKKGLHHLTRPFNAQIASDYMRICLGIEGGLKPNGEMISLHKDNPTNLYIPDSAA